MGEAPPGGDRLLLGIDQYTGILGKELLQLEHETPGTDATVLQDQGGNPSPSGRHAVQTKAMLAVAVPLSGPPPTLASPKPTFLRMQNVAKLLKLMILTEYRIRNTEH